MIPAHEATGLLPPGIHPTADWAELGVRLGATPWRAQLLDGFRRACNALASAGCTDVWLDGSFVTTKAIPGDFDACWNAFGVDPRQLDPVLLDFTNKRAKQKAKYLGELFPAGSPATAAGTPFVDFFQVDKASSNPKGIILIDPRSAP